MPTNSSSNPGLGSLNIPSTSGAAGAPAAAPDVSDGPDIHDIHGLAPLTYWERNGTRIILGSIAGVILLALILWLVLRKKPARLLTPYEVALRELDAARALPADAHDQAFAIAASDAVRHYLEKAYQMPAPERTTEEFLQEATRHAWLQGELAALLRRFLEFCDLAKFAGQELGTTEREQLLGSAHEFLDAAEKLRQPQTAAPAAQSQPTPPTPPVAPPPQPSPTAL